MARKSKKGVTGRPTAVLRMSGFPIDDGSPHVPLAVLADGTEYELIDAPCSATVRCSSFDPRVPTFPKQSLWGRCDVDMTIECTYAITSPKRKPPKKKAPKRAKKGR